MIINLSNHPSSGWTEEQRVAAQRYGDIYDIPFPVISPSWSTKEVANAAKDYCRRCVELFGDSPEPHVVHIAGEILFCYFAIDYLLNAGVVIVSSTTERNVTYNDRGEKISMFKFVQFRELRPHTTY